MACIQTFGQLSRLSCHFRPMTSLNPHKSLLFSKGSTPISQFINSKHILTETYKNHMPLSLHKFNYRKGIPFQFLDQAISTRTLFSSSNGKHILFISKSLHVTIRCASTHGQGSSSKSNRSALIYTVATFIFMIGAAYAGVPLYKVFCQASGLGGQAISKGHETEKIESMKKGDRQIKIRFNADVASSMRWNFRPQQTEVTVAPGETALAFYTAENPTNKPIIGISTYNVLPFDAGQYFNKIQCFCFEEQRLNPKEQVDMPVFFYIDPEFAEDPKLENVNNITLSYTFFEAKEGLQLPLPGYPQPHDPVVSTT